MQLTPTGDKTSSRSSAGKSSDARDLLFVLPSAFAASALFIWWFMHNDLPTVFAWVCGVLLFLSPVLTVYTLAILAIYIRRRNTVGVLLALVYLLGLGFASLVLIGLVIHGIALQT
jgi:hypothetical protein